MYIRCLLPLLLAHAWAKAPLYGSQNDIDSIRGEYLVVFKDNASWDCIQKMKLMSDLWATMNQQMDIVHSFHIHGTILAHIKAEPSTVEILRDMTDIKFIETNQVVTASEDFMTTEEPQVDCVRQEPGSSLWSLSRINSRDKPNYSPGVYDYSETDDGFGVDVYVADSGVNVGHADFEGRALHGITVPGLSSEGNADLHGHGTHVAGIVGGATYGIAKRANIVAVKVLNKFGTGNVNYVIQGIEWVVKREMAKAPHKRRAVLNLSLGTPSPVSSLDAAVQAAIAAGITVVAAAGNDAIDACSASPGRVSSAITVAASDRHDSLTRFSNKGPCVDIVAPGMDIVSTGIASSQSTQTMSGTSQATPHVAGVLARHLSALTNGTELTPAHLKAYLSDTATKNRLNMGSDTLGTPNALLFRECSAMPVQGDSPNSQSSSMRGQSIYWLIPLFSVMSCSLY